MIVKTEDITGHSVIDSAETEAFGYEISLLYFKKGEWKNIAQTSKKTIEKLGKYLDFINKNGPNSSSISAQNKTLLIKTSLRKDSRFYKVIKQKNMEEHYKYRLSNGKKAIRFFISCKKNKGYLICFDNNHTALNTSK